MPVPTEYDAQGKPIPATAASSATEYDASGQPIAAPNMQPHGASGNALTSGHPLETLRANYDEAARPSNASDGGVMGRGLHDLGRGFTETLAGPLIHPLDTIKGIGSTIGGMVTHPDQYDPENPINKMVGSIVQDFQDNGAASAIPHLAGQIGGGAIGGEVAGPVLGAAAKPLRTLGAATERGGLGVINHALEVTPKMMKYGQDPARGLVDEGLTPSMSRFSMGNKVDAALPQAGQRISTAVHGSPLTAPYGDVASSIEGPIHGAADTASGFGGGKSLEPLADLWTSTERTAPGASQPIYGGNVPHGTGVRAPDLWRSIQNLDRNTRFNPDPEVEGVNEVRRDIRGGLRNNLEDAVPGLKPLSQRYGDLATADEALSRTAGRGTPLKSFKDFFTFPAETAAGTAMVRGGRMLQNQIPGAAAKAIPGSLLFMGARSPQQ